MGVTSLNYYCPIGHDLRFLARVFVSVSFVASVFLSSSFDYSKAFWYSFTFMCCFQKLALMDLPDNIYNWFLNYLSDQQPTVLSSKMSHKIAPASINASAVQDSVLGPSLFNLNSCALHPISADNRYFKYADDVYLVVPFANAALYLTGISSSHSLDS